MRAPPWSFVLVALAVASCAQLAGVEDGELASTGGSSAGGTSGASAGGSGGTSAGGTSGASAGGTSAGGTSGSGATGGTSAGGTAGTDGGGGSKYAATVMSDGPVAYWRLGEDNTPTAFDASGNGHDGTYKDVVVGEPGAIVGDPDTAVRIKGTYTGGVDIGDVFDFDGHKPFTVELWVKAEVTDSCFLSKGERPDGGNFEGWFLYHGTNTTIRRAGTNTEAAPIVQGQWTHVVATHDGVSTSLFINGDLGAQKTDSASLPDSTSIMRIGRMNDWKPFVGVLDEVAIYDKNLSAARIKAHYLAGTGQ